jgi:hypothetical protein
MPSATGGSSSGRARQSSRVTAADGKARLDLELHPLDLIRLDEFVPAVVELRRPGRGVAGDRRGALERAAVEKADLADEDRRDVAPQEAPGRLVFGGARRVGRSGLPPCSKIR